MSEINKSHVQVYSGEFKAGNNYKKFDIVLTTGLKDVFYYAKKDIVHGGGATIEGYAGRFVIDAETHTLSDPNENGFLLEGHKFAVGQVVQITDDTHLENNNNFLVESVTSDVLTLGDVATLPALEALVDSDTNSSIDITAIDQTPGESSNQLWSQRDFFFDPDYGSSVNFTTQTSRFDFGEGYFSIQPKGINSVNAEFNLTFDNRTTREASSIMHFLENKLGQHEIDVPVDYLPYKDGISGFFWDGSSMFFPYNSTENLTKKFYCEKFSHSLTSENSNRVECTLSNLDTSILRKSEQIWVERVDDYDPEVTYERDDIVFVSGVQGASHQFYYHSGTTQSTDVDPLQENSSWTREFYWPPSLGLKVTESPRLKSVQFGSSAYTQIYSDGINESLLSLDLSFKNRDDLETKAILHFLETHCGAKSFSLTLPAPYNESRRFICPQWSHTYTFKDTHDIGGQFHEFPFNFTDEEFDNVVTPTELRGGTVAAPNFISMNRVGSEDKEVNGSMVPGGEKMRHRVIVKNMGDQPIEGLTLSGPEEYRVGLTDRDPFKAITYVATQSVPKGKEPGTQDGDAYWGVVNETENLGYPNWLSNSTYGIGQRVAWSSSFFGVGLGKFDSSKWGNTNLSNRETAVYTDDDFGQIRISRNISNGADGGLWFSQTDTQSGATIARFFQSNKGNIHAKDGSLPSSIAPSAGNPLISTNSAGYVNWDMINENRWLPVADIDTLLPGESCFFEVGFNPNRDPINLTDEANPLHAAVFRVACTTTQASTSRSYADVICFAFTQNRWRPSQKKQGSLGGGGIWRASPIDGTVVTTSETKSTNPYDGQDGALNGSIKVTIDGSTLTPKNLGAGAEAVKQWGISRNGGTQWLMFNSLENPEYQHTFKGVPSGVQHIAIADLNSETMLRAKITLERVDAETTHTWSDGTAKVSHVKTTSYDLSVIGERVDMYPND